MARILFDRSLRRPGNLLLLLLLLAVGVPQLANAGEVSGLNPATWIKKAADSLEPKPQCEPGGSALGPGGVHPLVRGARRALGVLYQDCDAVRLRWDEQSDSPRQGSSPIASTYLPERKANLRYLPKDKLDAYVDWHYALRSMRTRAGETPPGHPKPFCEDVTRAKPPIYGYGSKCVSYRDADSGQGAELRQVLDPRADRNQIKDGSWDGVDEKSGQPVASIDCSGLVALALAAGGLKVDSAQTSAEMVVGTMTLPQHADAATGCIKRATFSFPQGLQPGDILNMPAHHVVMVDSVGPDPLGIQQGVNSGNCDSITRDSFDFTLIHSGSAGDLGPARVSARFKTSPEASAGVMGNAIENNLISMARKVCQRKLAGQTEGILASQVGTANGIVFSVFRHQSERPGCVMTPAERPRIEGEQCLEANQCNLDFNG